MEFLSEEWFRKVAELKDAAGDLNVPEQMADIVLNVNVTMGNGEIRAMHMKGGEFLNGHDESTETTLSLQDELAKKIFIDGDTASGMQAFMAGEIKIDGDMTKVMTLQSVQPSDEQKRLLGQIKALTE